MYRTPVFSTNVRSIGYDPQTAVLEVEFDSGDVYQYFDVPENLHHGIMGTSSKGQFLNENIRFNYRYQKVS